MPDSTKGIDTDFLDDVTIGMRHHGGGQRNEVDSIKEGLVPVMKTAPEFLSMSKIPSQIVNAMTVLIAEAIHKGDIDLQEGKFTEKDFNYSTSLLYGKTLSSYALEGSSQASFKETIGGFMGGMAKRIRSFGTNFRNRSDGESEFGQ